MSTIFYFHEHRFLGRSGTGPVGHSDVLFWGGGGPFA